MASPIEERNAPRRPFREGVWRRRAVRDALRGEDRYVLLFFLLLLDLVVAAFATSATSVMVLLACVALTLLIALRTSRARPRSMRIALIAVVAGAIFGVVAVLENNPVWIGWMFAMMAALLFVTPIVIGRRILMQRKVTFETLFGAVSIYVIFGLLFAFVYLATRFISGEPFFANSDTVNPVNYVYMSYITLTTVGYGDFTPGPDSAKMIAALEALIGQVFLVTTVARLVSLYGREEQAHAGTGPEEAKSDDL